MTPKRFLTAQDMPIMPWVFSLQTSMVASAPSSQAVYWKERNILPAGKEKMCIRDSGAAHLPRSAGAAKHAGDLAVGDDLAARYLGNDAVDLLVKGVHLSSVWKRAEKLVSALPALHPVSYPHLDVYKRQLEDCCDVIDSLIAGNVVVLTLDEIDPKLTQRAIDTLSGAVFALNATIRKASDRTYVLAPSTVEVNETYDVERRF